MIIQRFLIITNLLLFTFILNSQNINTRLVEYEDTLNSLFKEAFLKDSIRFLKTDKEKYEINNRILTVFQQALECDNSFNHPFSTLKNVGIVTSKNKLLKVYTWNLKFKNFDYKYYGFVQYYNERKKKYVLFNLTDNTNNIVDPELAILSNTNWYGALYYEIFEEDIKGETDYVLLGWKGNSINTNKKVIETLCVSNAGKLVFGKPIISIDNKTKKRLIFEFSIKTNMVLKYNDYVKMIIFDHLSPPNPSLKGQYQFYGSDGSYDGLKFENDSWRFNSNVIVGDPPTKTVRD